jgi:cellobiose-specific phosphotransferase system component IIA
MEEFLCNECRGAHTMAARKCTQCSNITNSCYKLCTICAMQADECQSCRKKMNAGVEQKTIDEIVAFRVTKGAAIAQADADYQAAIAPLEEAHEAYTKADMEAGDEFNRNVKPAREAYDNARAALVEQKRLRSEGQPADVDAAEKALEEATPAIRAANENGRKLIDERRATTNLTYGVQRAAYEEAGRAHQSARWKAERRMDLSVGRVLGHIAIELGYKAAMEQLDQQQ